VVGVVVGVMMGGGAIVSRPVATQFNRFANYVLYGKDVVENIDVATIDTDYIAYEVTTKLSGETSAQKEEERIYYAKLSELAKLFIEEYGDTENEEADSIVKNINDISSFLYEYSRVSDLSIKSLANLYGKDENYINNYVTDYYRNLRESDNEYSNKYGTLMTEFLKIESNIMSKHDLFGACLSEQKNESACQSVISGITDSELKVLEEGDRYIHDAKEMVVNYSKLLAYYVVEFVEYLNGGRV